LFTSPAFVHYVSAEIYSIVQNSSTGSDSCQKNENSKQQTNKIPSAKALIPLPPASMGFISATVAGLYLSYFHSL